jgi:tetratricopeptide (TPR) repeat protein
MQQRLGHNPEAIATLHKFLAWKPDDTDAKKSLAIAFRAVGKIDSAEVVERAMVAQFAKTNLDSLDTGDLMAVGVAAFNSQHYPEAETAFAKAVKRNPYGRDARYNLANTYFAMKDYPKLIEHSSKLLEQEPMNEDALRLVAQGQRLLKQDEALLKTAERLVALPFTVDVSSFQMGQTGSKLSLEAVGRTPQDATGKNLKLVPMTLVVEFLDATGTVVDTKEVTVPTLTPTTKHPIQVDAKGAGIVAWRYHAK